MLGDLPVRCSVKMGCKRARNATHISPVFFSSQYLNFNEHMMKFFHDDYPMGVMEFH